MLARAKASVAESYESKHVSLLKFSVHTHHSAVIQSRDSPSYTACGVSGQLQNAIILWRCIHAKVSGLRCIAILPHEQKTQVDSIGQEGVTA